MNTILLEKSDFIAPDVVCIADSRAEHMRKILKCRIGSTCKVGLLNDQLGTGEVLALDDKTAQMRVNLTTPAPPVTDLVLACAMQRPQTYKKVLHIAITMGVKKLLFFGSFKVEKSYWDSPVLSGEIFKREAVAALEQCCDTVMPQVEYCRYFKQFADELLPELSCNRTVYLAHPACQGSFPARPQLPALLLMGPEGGFTDYEINHLLEAGAVGGTLGPRILRTETALAALLGRFIRN
ncbi:MAG: 16S rRNA (uracil(1498)-N(3))-methyltransferase [Lentisphaerae bacterium]|nr:16S rRNA (uracil(1498)-N(3))-methyltransferase [Lentisphaerota bacterium]